MTIRKYLLEVRRLMVEAKQPLVRPGMTYSASWMKERDVVDDFKEGLTPAQSCLNWVVGRKVCGDLSSQRRLNGLIAMSALI